MPISAKHVTLPLICRAPRHNTLTYPIHHTCMEVSMTGLELDTSRLCDVTAVSLAQDTGLRWMSPTKDPLPADARRRGV